MALPSGTIRLSEVMAEFGGATPPNWMQAYLKGGAYVTTHDYAPNVPTDLNDFSLRDFCGAYKVTSYVTITPSSVAGLGDGTPGPVVSDWAEVSYYGFHGASTTIGWAKLSGDTIPYTTLYSGSQIYFHKYMNLGEELIATYRCTVSDLLGNEAYADLGVTMVNN